MSLMTTTELSAAIRKLSVEQRLELIGDIWDSLDAEHESLEMTETQRRELDRRLEDADRSPHDFMDWGDVKAWIRSGDE